MRIAARHARLEEPTGEWLECLRREIPAQMQMGSSWHKGTADAIRQNISFIERAHPRLVLPGDHIHKMNYAAMRRVHGGSS